MSIKRCCVSTCINTRADNTILHLFPDPDKDLLRFNAWRNAIGGHIMSLDHQTVFNLRRVCHIHFETQYHTRSKRLSNNALPTLHLSGITREQPLQDIINQVTTETNINPSTSAHSPLPSVIQMSKLVPVQTKTSKIGCPISITKEPSKKPFKCFSAEIISLKNKIKLLQKRANSLEVKRRIQIMEGEYDVRIETLKKKIKSFPDFPKKGILFWDIFSAIADGPTCQLLQNILVDTVRSKFPDVEAIVGLESRGFLFSFSLAAALGISCLPVRKKGKLPGEVVSHKYDLEYGSDIMELQKGSITPGLKCLIIDDLIATGGSINAAANLLQSCGANVLGCLVIIELESLKGKHNIPEGVRLHSLIKYD